MNNIRTFGKRTLAVLSACMIPLTGMFTSAPLVANAADNYVTFETKTSSVVSKDTEGSTTINGRNIAKNTSSEYALPYKYTGNIFTANSSLYDYLSDNEVNGFSRYSEAAGYADAYTYLNDAISGQLVSPSSENLTIRYEDDEKINRNFKVYLYNSQSNQNNGWPGVAMQNRGEPNVYIYTVKYSDLGFNPDRIIISAENDTGEWHGSTLSRNLVKGKCYSILKDTITEGKAADIYNRTGSYNVPLYFGCFYLDDDPNDTIAGDYAAHYEAYKKADGTYKGRTHSNYYQNFYWQANLSLRKDNNGDVNFDASVQGLVDNTLTNDTITQNGKILPYFSDEWADSHSNLVKYWHNIAFPFYEIEVDADKVRGDGGNGKAKYYQFNSKEGNKYSLYFEADDVNKTGTYKETTTAIVSQPTTTDEDGTVSYLPFNSKNDYKKNNLGFGMTFEMNFHIRPDGKVDTYDKNTGKPTGKSVNATFEFMGDDDVWVFIDDQLVLDLGGAHKDTTGIIDFAEKKAYANDAITLGAGSGKDDLWGGLSSQKIVNLQDVMVSGTFNTDGTYNEEKVHTLKMFYMERGMYESDLLVRFNFSTTPNTLKIKEVTQFKDINAGLLDLTKKAADYDVFDYSISNSGTSKNDVEDSGIVSPTYNYYQRDNLGQKALLSGQTLEDPTKYVYLDVSTFTSWLNDNAKIAAYVYGNGKTAKTILGEAVGDNLYRFDTDGYKGIDFIRVSKYCTKSFPYEGYLDKNDGGYWDRVQYGDFIPGATYKITGWSSAEFESESEDTVYEEHKFDPTQGTAVKNVNYIWTDQFASVISGTDTNGLVGTTDGNGKFRLMYGTDDTESSAEFQKQFKKGSTMTVNQLDSLKTVERTNPETTPEPFNATMSRSVKEYYDTTVTVVDNEGGIIIPETATSNTSYEYSNKNPESKNPVKITETFVNTPKVGAITVTKMLNPSDKVDDDFVFTIRLYDVFGVTGKDELTVTDYSAITANKTLTTVDAVIDGKSVKAGQFTLKRDETLTIQGVPYGTKYTVVETPAKKYEQKSNTAETEQTVYQGTFDETHDTITPASQNAETVVNTRLTNSLTLSKALAGDYTETDVDEDTQFDFTVNFTAPTGVTLSDYKFKIDGSEITGTSSITVKVSKNQSVTISGIPYDTGYTVSEALSMDNWSNDGDETGTIGETASTATITNTYTKPAVGNLEITKNVLTPTGSADIEDSDKTLVFEFTVTLTDKNNAELTTDDDFSMTKTTVTGVSDDTLHFVKGVATVTLCDDESVLIKGIPAGYNYTVEESYMAGFTPSSTNAESVIVKDTTVTAAFTNTKIFQPYELPDAGFEDTRMYFVFMLAGMFMFGIAYWYVNRSKAKG